jgi:ankyrin repeat protein
MKRGIYYIIALFLFQTARVFAQDINLDNQLLLAAYEGDTVEVQMLLRRGANANIATNEKITPLMFAAENGYTGVVRTLMQNGAKVDLVSNNGYTALIMAIMGGYIETAETLVRNGANVNLTDDNEITPLMHAIMVDTFYLPDMLLYYSASVLPKDDRGMNALMYASRLGCYEIAATIMEAGININDTDLNGNTALHYAASGNNATIMDLLLLNGAEVDSRNSDGLTPLAIAVERNNYRAVKLLIGSGADVNARITKTLNPLNIATNNKNNDIKKLLIVNSAYPSKHLSFDTYSIGLKYVFNSKDSQFGFNVGYNESRLNLMTSLGYGFRPNAIRVLKKEDAVTSYQFWERRHYISLNIEKGFLSIDHTPHISSAAFAGVSELITFGGYKGSKDNPDIRMVFNPRIGCMATFGSFRFKFSYDFIDLKLKGYDNGWFSVSMEILAKRKSNKIKLP